MAIEPLRPTKGGLLKPFGCGLFIRDFLAGKGPYSSPVIDPDIGAPQADIFRNYKLALMRATVEDKAIRTEEKRARKENRRIEPDNIEELIEEYLSRMTYKAHGCRSHSFVTYFSMLQKLEWVEPSGIIEKSDFQKNYPEGQPRIFFRLTDKGKSTPDSQWGNPHKPSTPSNLAQCQKPQHKPSESNSKPLFALTKVIYRVSLGCTISPPEDKKCSALSSGRGCNVSRAF